MIAKILVSLLVGLESLVTVMLLSVIQLPQHLVGLLPKIYTYEILCACMLRASFSFTVGTADQGTQQNYERFRISIEYQGGELYWYTYLRSTSVFFYSFL